MPQPAYSRGRLGSPAEFPFRHDAARRQTQFLVLSERLYAEAAFLDERIEDSATDAFWLPDDVVFESAATLEAALDFVFHIGHTGSTLLSRIMDISDETFSVREPRLLRDLALAAETPPGRAPVFFEHRDRWLTTLLRLWSRTFRSPQRVLLKTTSFVSEIGLELMAEAPASRAILLMTTPRHHLASILAGPATRHGLPAASAARVSRLRGRLGAAGAALEAHSPGEQAALGWVCEVTGLERLARAFPDRTLWLEFGAFTRDASPALQGIEGFLGRSHQPEILEDMLRSPVWGRYSKSVDVSFSPASREEMLRAAMVDHAIEIDRGLAWINRLAGEVGDVARSLEAVARALSTPRTPS